MATVSAVPDLGLQEEVVVEEARLWRRQRGEEWSVWRVKCRFTDLHGMTSCWSLSSLSMKDRCPLSPSPILFSSRTLASMSPSSSSASCPSIIKSVSSMSLSFLPFRVLCPLHQSLSLSLSLLISVRADTFVLPEDNQVFLTELDEHAYAYV